MREKLYVGGVSNGVKKILAITLLALAFPALASAATLAELQAQIQALLTQIAILQGNPGGVVSSENSAACPNLSRNLSRGMKGGDITQLQSFFIGQGHLDAGNNTGFFGALTEGAVKQFQCKYMQICSGTAAANGYGAVGPRTRLTINQVCTGNTSVTIGAPVNVAIAPAYQPSTVVSPAAPACTVHPFPSCILGTEVHSLGNDALGCSLGYTCKPSTSSASCAFNGYSIGHGQSVTAYLSTTVSYGQSCVSQSRTCTNGVLGGSYAYTSCAALPPTTSPPPVTPPTVTPPSLLFPKYWFAPLPQMPTRPGRPYVGSLDYMSLFSVSAPWQTAASRIQVFTLYGEWLLPGNATDAEILQLVSDLKHRGIALAVEGGPLDPTSTCGNGIEGFARSQWPTYISRIKAAGGKIDYVQMDEPYYFGHVYSGTQACNWSADTLAAKVKDFSDYVRSEFPNVVIGTAEPAVTGDGAAFREWYDAYARAHGYPLAFLHLDVQWDEANWPTRARSIEDVSRAAGVSFGIMYNGSNETTDMEWIQTAGDHVKEFELARGGRPDQVVFQSWTDKPDYSLPETTPNTFTNFINAYFGDKSKLGHPPPAENIALGKSTTASRQEVGNEAAKAFDGDVNTKWVAGSHAPQWIQVDLGVARTITGVRLIVDQYPDGATMHTVYGSATGQAGSWQTITTFQSVTTNGQTLNYTLANALSGVRYIKVETTSSPSWVSWREIQVVGQ